MLVVSGIVVFGVLVISVVIGWYVYRRRIPLSPPTSNEHVQKIERTVDKRLKPDLITFSYKKESDDGDPDQNEDDEEALYRKTSTTIECVVCLRGLEDEEIVRRLPKRKNIFHAPCIDMWLDSHSGCPICRTLIDRLLSGDNQLAFTPHKDQENSMEVTPTGVDNIRTSMLSIPIV
ncbi:hypothetical protein C1H46_021527 [Malus baccata]|uniref:RING-type domain-containing protein n=1 Tax=Malus baccata TaxID=106549 RepID=A0A540M275_MALBA|nr:hypothetical protein C1H46_021527 [Malus baccata]